MTPPTGGRRPDPFGKRVLFGPLPADLDVDGIAGRRRRRFAGPRGVPGPSARADSERGRRAVFSATDLGGPAVVVECRRCRARTPLGPGAFLRRLVPSLWLPMGSWTRWMRCPSCRRFTWCRIDWSRLLSRR